jgi:hypothetical protein
MVPIISESMSEERKARAPPLQNSELVVAGKTSGIKTTADFFPEL